jgi:hypothetical protein
MEKQTYKAGMEEHTTKTICSIRHQLKCVDHNTEYYSYIGCKAFQFDGEENVSDEIIYQASKASCSQRP